MNHYSGIIGFVGVPTTYGTTVPGFTHRELPLPVLGYGGEDRPIIGKIVNCWLDTANRIWVDSYIDSKERLLSGGMDMDLIDGDEWRLMAFTAYPIDKWSDAAWPGVHLLRTT